MCILPPYNRNIADMFLSHILYSQSGTHDNKQVSVCHCAVPSILSSNCFFGEGVTHAAEAAVSFRTRNSLLLLSVPT